MLERAGGRKEARGSARLNFGPFGPLSACPTWETGFGRSPAHIRSGLARVEGVLMTFKSIFTAQTRSCTCRFSFRTVPSQSPCAADTGTVFPSLFQLFTYENSCCGTGCKATPGRSESWSCPLSLLHRQLTFPSSSVLVHFRSFPEK